jgi:hypothetical protein
MTFYCPNSQVSAGVENAGNLSSRDSRYSGNSRNVDPIAIIELPGTGGMNRSYSQYRIDFAYAQPAIENECGDRPQPFRKRPPCSLLDSDRFRSGSIQRMPTSIGYVRRDLVSGDGVFDARHLNA